MLYETILSKTAQFYTRKHNLNGHSRSVNWIGLPKDIFQDVIKKTCYWEKWWHNDKPWVKTVNTDRKAEMEIIEQK